MIDSHERNNETAMTKNRTTKLQERVVIVKFWEIISMLKTRDITMGKTMSREMEWQQIAMRKYISKL